MLRVGWFHTLTLPTIIPTHTTLCFGKMSVGRLSWGTETGVRTRGSKVMGWRSLRYSKTTLIIDTLSHYSYFILQAIPPGSPNLLKPCFKKLDLPKLLADIPKYAKAGLPLEKAEFWERLQDKLKSMESRSSEEAEWIIPRLAQKHRTQSDQVLRDADIPGTIVEACEKDHAPIPEVYIFVSMTLCICHKREELDSHLMASMHILCVCIVMYCVYAHTRVHVTV